MQYKHKLSHDHSIFVKYQQLHNFAKQLGIILAANFRDDQYPDHTFIAEYVDEKLTIWQF